MDEKRLEIKDSEKGTAAFDMHVWKLVGMDADEVLQNCWKCISLKYVWSKYKSPGS